MSKILVIKNDDCIIISQNGKRLVIDKDNNLFELLKVKNNNEIIKWYLSERR